MLNIAQYRFDNLPGELIFKYSAAYVLNRYTILTGDFVGIKTFITTPELFTNVYTDVTIYRQKY